MFHPTDNLCKLIDVISSLNSNYDADLNIYLHIHTYILHIICADPEKCLHKMQLVIPQDSNTADA